MTDFQRSSVEQGRYYEGHVRAVLTMRGWVMLSDRPMKVLGGEVDIVAFDPDGVLHWIECKGSYKDRPGLLRDDTAKKAIAVAWMLKRKNPDRPRYIIVSSDLPKVGSLSSMYINEALEAGIIDGVMEL